MNLNTNYRTDQPRISVASPATAYRCSLEMEIGQANAIGEAMFWHSIGYTVHVAWWDGKYFSNRQTYSADQPLTRRP